MDGKYLMTYNEIGDTEQLGVILEGIPPPLSAFVETLSTFFYLSINSSSRPSQSLYSFTLGCLY